MIKTIPLNKLVASPRNVRRSGNPEADQELKADIATHGLLQNLVVSSVRKPRGCFAVEAGERRRQALQRLADEGKLPASHEVPCLVIDGSAATETSLAENFQRLAMNPADECLAFQALVEQGSDAEAIASRFGLTTRFVEGRLRLADLTPEVFEALGSGAIGLEIAKAYASVPDRERQAYVFEQVNQSYMASHSDTIRRMMTHATIGGSDRRALFVGEATYTGAGGRVERDLFAEESETRWLDVPLVERLAADKLEAEAAAMAQDTGLAWVRPVLGDWLPYDALDGLRRLEVESPALTSEEETEVEALGEQIALLEPLAEDEEADESERALAEDRLRELGDRLDAIVSKPPVLPDELRGIAGAFLLLDRDGTPMLDPRRFAVIEEDGEPVERGPAKPAAEETEPRPKGLARRLVDELAMQRRDILAVHVAADRGFAFDLAAFLLADGTGAYVFETSGSALRPMRPTDPVSDFKAPDLAASVALSAAEEALDRSWTGGATRAARFDAFRALPEAARRLWFSFAIARTLEASANIEGPRACTFHDHLGQALGVETQRWWRPTAANYFDRVPKSVTLAALAEVGGQELVNRYAKLKKGELSEACERVFAGETIVEADVKQAVLAWVPEAMRFASPGTAEPPDEDADQVVGTAGEADAGAGADDLEAPREELDEAA